MMKLLVLGGTRFLGRHIVEAALAAGHQLSVFNRGVSADNLPTSVERLRGDRDASDLQALQGRRWDACIDVSGYTPRQLLASTALLADAVQRYVFISAVSVYGDPQQRPVDEVQPLLPPAADDLGEIDGASYGPLKVRCEQIVGACFGAARTTLLRPQVVVGPGDDWMRYSYWVQRARRAAETGGPMLAPGDGSDHLQVIDVRDLARFALRTVEQSLSGPYNLAGPRLRWDAFMALLGVARPVWVPAPLLQAAGLGFMELPLYRPERGPRAGLMDVSATRALADGLLQSDPARTLADVRADLQAHIGGRSWAPALSAEREAALMEQVRAC